MSHEARQLILNIHRLTGQQVCHIHPLAFCHLSCQLTVTQIKAMESLAKIQGPLEQLQSRHNSSTVHQKHLYTIEWINVND